MRTSVFVGLSLDGFLARADGAFDFLAVAEREAHGYDEFIATVDAVVMGRKTYDVVLALAQWPYGSLPVFVLSTRELPIAPSGAVVERLHAAPAAVHAQLAERGYRHAYIDGGLTVQAFLRAGLIDSITINRVPVLIGAGVPLFGPLDHDLRPRHLSTRVLPSGAVQSEYAA